MRILVVDDSKFQQAATRATLKKEGQEEVLLAGSVDEALGLLAGEEKMDLILLDIEMPEVNGIEGCRRIKADEDLRDIPVIMITGRDDTDSLKAAFEAGAMDFIPKTASPVEVGARVRSALQLKKEMDRRKAKERELLDLTQKLTSANQMLRDLAVVDPLTQIPNRRYFDEVLGRDWRRAKRDQRPVALIMIDIDHFKQYNDAYGHSEG
ncbi:MAG: response regulator, partial [Thermodesulfobacteriota bacterium]